MGRQSPFSLPLDLLLIIIEEAVIAFSASDTLRLRLVNRTFDHEVLRAIASRGVFLGENEDLWKARVPWHQSIDYDRIDESAFEFWVRYFLERPHWKGPWNCSLPLLLNSALDAILEQAGMPIDHPCRRPYMRVLLKETIPRKLEVLDERKYPYRLSQAEWLGGNICTDPESPITRATFEAHVLHAQLILGDTEPCRRLLRSGELSRCYFYGRGPSSGVPTAFGPVPCSLARSGSAQLVKDIFPAREEGAGCQLSGTKRAHRLLLYAVEARSMDMVRTLMEAPERRYRYTAKRHWEEAVARAIHLRELDIARYLLSKASTYPVAWYFVHEAFRSAAHYGDNDIFLWALRHGRNKPPVWNPYNCCVTPMELACRAGNVETVQLLLDHGFNPRGKGVEKPTAQYRRGRVECPLLKKFGCVWADASAGCMFWAAAKGHTHIGEMLVRAGIRLSAYEWRVAALAAVELGQTEFLRWMVDSGSLARWYGTDIDSDGNRRHPATLGKPDLVGHVCVWGSPEMLRMLVARGYSVEGPIFFESQRYDNIVLAALEWARPDMVQALLELGLAEVDPLKSERHGLWERGEFPRRARTRALVDAALGEINYPSLVPPSEADGATQRP